MPSDYEQIRADNQRAYGTAIGRIGPMLLADRYDDRTHFIFELLQNAEDALARRREWTGRRSIRFELNADELRISHYGKPFDYSDVRGVCGIAESTKGLTEIGRFGIGFKSVYAYTDRPAIHSGDEDFAIESFVWPVGTAPIRRQPDETIILLPLRNDSEAQRAEIATALERMGGSALLFLRELDEIEWKVQGGGSGIYVRSKPDRWSETTRRVSILGQQEGKPDVEEDWLIFSRQVSTKERIRVGSVEAAFSIAQDDRRNKLVINPVAKSPLVAFFPTVLETHLGFLIQGPYRTTPSRDNVPRQDAWNRHCVAETAAMLSDALRTLRDRDLLDVGVLRCLPIDSAKFGPDSMFEPLFAATKLAFATLALLPRFPTGYVSAKDAKLARTNELRSLFSEDQLRTLFAAANGLAWLSSDFSADRTPEIRQYLIRELEVAEVTPETVLARLSADFLRHQSDDWICKLYEFLNEQPALRYRIVEVPLVRLETGEQVFPFLNEQPQAFLPGSVRTGFPTVAAAVCSSDAARAFLHSIGLTEPNAVDDVLRNVLPRYRSESIEVSDTDYENDIGRIARAFATDSKGQREKLVSALSSTTFIQAVDVGDRAKYFAEPGLVYIATERLKQLFAGVPNVLLVDDDYQCLRGDDIRELLEACGAVRYLRPVPDNSLAAEQLAELRESAGHSGTSGINDRVVDWSLSGLNEFLRYLPTLESGERRERAKLFWDELGHLEERRGKAVFSGEYSWTHYGRYRTPFDAAFVKQLNDSAWIADIEGTLRRPDLVAFASLSWRPNPFLESKIRFKPPVIAQLAREAGIEPDVLDLLKKLGVTSAAELSARLGITEDVVPVVADAPTGDETSAEDAGGANRGSDGGDPNRGDLDDGSTDESAPDQSQAGEADVENNAGASNGATTHRSGGRRSFVSYVAVGSDSDDSDPEGLAHARRMELEARAIATIIAREPRWRQTSTLNEGFDLTEEDDEGQTTRWCEVKAMTGTLRDRPATLSRAQFECAREHGANYWLYVVEHAGDEAARIIRIQDPAGKARTFTFDSGWLGIAELEGTAD